MAALVFAHGTGGRKKSYDQTFALISTKISEHAIALMPVKCLWGDTLGSMAPALTIPGLTIDAEVSRIQDEDEQRWTELAVDPFIELRLIAASPAEPPAPGGFAKAREVAAANTSKVLAYTLRGEPLATVSGWGLDDLWPFGWAAFLRGAELVQSVFAARRNVGEPGRAAARAATACLLLAAVAEGRALPTREQRNSFVTILADDMNVLTEGVMDTIKSFFVSAGLKAATEAAGPHRGPFSRQNGILAGDILVYQARGDGIRRFIKSRVEESCREHGTDSVYLLGHSLGGIACVDLLAKESLPVKGLITVGSQASLFAEFGALVSFEPGVNKLRDDFPNWLNVYDEHDFLSYLAAPVFGPKARDVRVDSEQPFPLSHGAYWSNSQTWRAIADFVK